MAPKSHEVLTLNTQIFCIGKLTKTNARIFAGSQAIRIPTDPYSINSQSMDRRHTKVSRDTIAYRIICPTILWFVATNVQYLFTRKLETAPAMAAIAAATPYLPMSRYKTR